MEKATFRSTGARKVIALACFGAFTSFFLCCHYLNKKENENVVFTLYTVNNGILKMTAQMYPADPEDAGKAVLQTKEGDGWKSIAEEKVVLPDWRAYFRVENWDSNHTKRYRVKYRDSSWKGVIRKNPVDKEEIMVAAFTGNGPRPNVPKTDIVKYLKKYDPDLLVFTGDQVYRHHHHLGAWIEFGENFGELTRDRPTVCIPDDHDVGNSNLWGASGRKTDNIYEGGYPKPAEYVKQVERAQTSHLPDPYDPTPVKQDIGTYYTSLTWGGISFAIIEDRKFKSGPEGVMPDEWGPRPDHVTVAEYDKEVLDAPGKKLLGQRQLKFLRDWADDWKGAEMKAVISQTAPANVSTHQQIIPFYAKWRRRIYADLDSNGWPKSGRDRMLRILRKAFAFIICGDQHLATLVHHGIDKWNDAGLSFCVPSIANYWRRWWLPEEPGKNRRPGAPEYTGEFVDGLGNKITVKAVANPTETGRKPTELHDKAPGYGIIKFNKRNRTITVECWPRQVDPTVPKNAKMQYPGWPRTISQTDNYARKPAAYLPEIHTSGTSEPVVKVINEKSSELVYALRINGNSFRPMVFDSGKHTLVVGEPGGKTKTLKGVQPLERGGKDTIRLKFDH